jgi:choloylglycine hydrolase
MVGLPGDFSPPSRFVRAAIFATTAMPSATSPEAVFQAFHILNQFDIPVGIVRDVENGVVHTDSTLATTVRDPQTMRYYFKTYDDQTIKMVDLKTYDPGAKNIQRISMSSVPPAMPPKAPAKRS